MNKKYKIIISALFSVIFLLAFTSPLSPPPSGWYQQFMPSIGSKQINDITFLDSLTGFAVASRNVNPDTSSILKTTNKGDNWLIVFTQAPRRFSRVKFVNLTTGFISGGSGSGTPYLYKTTDGGNNWFTIPGATLGTAFWNDMAVLNEDTIWLVDQNSFNGGVFRTTNGGVSWQQQPAPPSDKIYMYNARIGFISNSSASPNIYKTTNGGTNWVVNVSGEKFFDISFVDSLTGWRSSEVGDTIYKTTNGGNNWFSQLIPHGGIIITAISKFAVLNIDTVWGVGGLVSYGSNGSRGILYRTTNGGNNWLFQVPDTSIHITGYFYIQFVDKNKGWAYHRSQGGIHTTTGGDTIWYTGIQQVSSEVPAQFKLYQNYPNPFNPRTVIRYQIVNSKEQISNVKLIVYDIQGREIIKLVNKEQTAGTYEVDFSGNGLSSGVYFYRMIVDSQTIDTKKMILVK